MALSHRIQLLLSVIGLFVFFVICYDYLLAQKVESFDVYAHFNAAVEIKRGDNQYPANFLLYWLTNLGSTLYAQKAIFISIIGGSIVAKFLITFYILYNGAKVHFYIALLGALSLLFVISLPSLHVLQGYFYLGNFTPNVWHNSTIIFVMPLSMWLFYYGILNNYRGACVFDGFTCFS